MMYLEDHAMPVFIIAEHHDSHPALATEIE
jgi:hypothetical protein